jgi:peptide-methionine (R)-S-oxide reductase
MGVKQLNPDLSEQQKDVLFNSATEAPGTGALLHNDKTGVYTCANCGSTLFASGTKFDSGSGWPSFYEPANLEAVELVQDDSHGMSRTEVRCKTCGGHLGHLFADAYDQPTGQRFCINSASLDFKEK